MDSIKAESRTNVKMQSLSGRALKDENARLKQLAANIGISFLASPPTLTDGIK
ncbi:MAG: hypothetical protein M9932_17755 [Xanthobacteraceae bacterium]|nr:hypothetical protein [Xanthobacteraceae bacterium]